jgi:hypothetical protein
VVGQADSGLWTVAVSDAAMRRSTMRRVENWSSSQPEIQTPDREQSGVVDLVACSRTCW